MRKALWIIAGVVLVFGIIFWPRDIFRPAPPDEGGVVAPDNAPVPSSQGDSEAPATTQPKIVCDRFDMVAEVTAAGLSLRLDTDLPDGTRIIVDVSRSYWVRGMDAGWSVPYFTLESTAGEWRAARTVTLDDVKCADEVIGHLAALKARGDTHELASIDPDLELSTFVDRQADPAFGKDLVNLTGKAVQTPFGMPQVGLVMHVKRPLSNEAAQKIVRAVQQPATEKPELKVGAFYLLSRPTPLTQQFEGPTFVDLDEIASKTVTLSPGTLVQVQEVSRKREGAWYRVQVWENDKTTHAGWINATSLVGQVVTETEAPAKALDVIPPKPAKRPGEGYIDFNRRLHDWERRYGRKTTK